ncbi:MAG: GNAT family N-acetyltransferase [Caldilineaceae bacterium]|nr:GNAT family N-acetyltransferase [Caldilineaceae bacterium]
MFTMRPFDYSDADYAAAVAIQNAAWPDQPETVAFWQHRDAIREPDYFYQAFLVETATHPVAYGFMMETPWSYRPGKYALGITVRPAYERRGIGALLYDSLLQQLLARPQPLTMLTGHVREDKAASIRFVQKRGFSQVMRSPVSQLTLATFDPTPFVSTADAVQASGIVIHSAAALSQFDPDYRQKIYALDWQCTLDEPLPDAPSKPPFDQYVKFFFDNPRFVPAGCFIAVDQGTYVGMSNLFRNLTQTTAIDTGFTAVLRTHRRRGIATALKLRAIEYAQQQAYQTIKTSNEENNPMFAINVMLGFEPLPAWLDFQKLFE